MQKITRAHETTRWGAYGRKLQGKKTASEIVAKLCQSLVVLFQPFCQRFRPDCFHERLHLVVNFRLGHRHGKALRFPFDQVVIDEAAQDLLSGVAQRAIFHFGRPDRAYIHDRR